MPAARVRKVSPVTVLESTSTCDFCVVLILMSVNYRLSKLFSLGARPENPPPVEPAAVAAACSQFSLDSLDDQDDPAEKHPNSTENSALRALEAELGPTPRKTVADEDGRQALRNPLEKSSQKAESVTKSNGRNVRGKQCAVVEKSQLVGAEVSPVEPEFDQASSATTLTTPSAVTSVPVSMTSAIEFCAPELPSVPAVTEKISDSANYSAQASIPESLEKRKKNKRSRRRKSSGGKSHASIASESLPIVDSLRESVEIGSEAGPNVDSGTSESVVPISGSEDSSPRASFGPTDIGTSVDVEDEEPAPLITPSSPREEPNDGLNSHPQIPEESRQIEALIDLGDRESVVPTESDHTAPSCDESRAGVKPDLGKSPILGIVDSAENPSVTDAEEVTPPVVRNFGEKTAVQRILEFSEDGEIDVGGLVDNAECDPTKSEDSASANQIESELELKHASSSENVPCSDTAYSPTLIEEPRPAPLGTSLQTVTKVRDQEAPANLGSHEKTTSTELSVDNSGDSCADTLAAPREFPEITLEPRSGSGSSDQSPTQVGVSPKPAQTKEDESSESRSVENKPQPTPDTAWLCRVTEANREICHAAATVVQDSDQTDPSVPPRFVSPETAENGGLFIPLDADIPDHLNPSQKIRQRKSRSPDYRSEATRKLQEHRRFQHQLPVSQRPSKKLREECSMTSPVPGDGYDMDSLNTTCDSISPDTSFAQDLTYDIVDEPKTPQKKLFTFGLEAAEAALKPKPAARPRKQSEESPSLASEEETDPQCYPGGAALQLSVSISNGSNDSLAPCSMNVEDLVRCLDSSNDLLSFSYVPGTHKIFVPSENVSSMRIVEHCLATGTSGVEGLPSLRSSFN